MRTAVTTAFTSHKNPFPFSEAHYTEFNPPITHGDTDLALSPPLTLLSRQRDVPHGYVWSASDLATSNSSSTVSQNHLVHCNVSRSAHVFRLNFGNPFHSVTTGYQQHVANCAVQPLYTRVGTLIVATIYLQLIENRYMFRSFTVLQCSHQHCLQPVASDVEVVGYL